MRRHSWERISHVFKVSSRIMKISPWSRCSMSPRSWWMIRRKSMVWTIHWEKNSWKRLSLIGDETVINLQSTSVYVFSDYVFYLGRILQLPDSKEAWKNRIAGVKSVRSYRDYDGINEEPTEFEFNIFPGFTTLQLCGKLNDHWATWDKHQKLSQEEPHPCRCSMTSLVTKGNKDECLANAAVVKVFARKFGAGQWSFIGPGSEKKWYSAENSPQGAWVILRKKCCWNLQKVDILLSVERLHCPGVNSREKRAWKAVDALRCRWTNNWDNFSHYHFCQSAQCLRSSGRYMWRIWRSSRWIGRTWDFDGSFNCSRWNEGRSSFAERKTFESSNFMATVQRTNWIAFTRK